MKTVITNLKSRRDFFRGRGLLEAKCAWLSFGAIMALEHILTKDMMVLELGGGGSTLFFADRVKMVTTIETNEEWMKLLQEKTTQYDNIHLLFKTEEQAVTYIQEYDDGVFDVILVDTGWNPEHRSPNRRLLADTAKSKLKQNGFLILDNYNHYGNRTFDLHGWDVYTFDDFNYSGKGTRILQKL